MAASYSFVPSKDSLLLAWSNTLNLALIASAASLGMTSVQATAYSTAHLAFATALATAVNPATRTKGTVNAKDVAKKALVDLARAYGKMIQANPAIAEQKKIDVGIPPRAAPTPIPAPTATPVIEIVSVVGNTVRIKLTDNLLAKRGKPAGCAGASVFSLVSPTRPTSPAGFRFEGNTSKNLFDIMFDDTLTPGTQVWICAFWFNQKCESGPSCAPLGTFLQGGIFNMAA